MCARTCGWTVSLEVPSASSMLGRERSGRSGRRQAAEEGEHVQAKPQEFPSFQLIEPANWELGSRTRPGWVGGEADSGRERGQRETVRCWRAMIPMARGAWSDGRTRRAHQSKGQIAQSATRCANNFTVGPPLPLPHQLGLGLDVVKAHMYTSYTWGTGGHVIVPAVVRPCLPCCSVARWGT